LTCDDRHLGFLIDKYKCIHFHHICGFLDKDIWSLSQSERIIDPCSHVIFQMEQKSKRLQKRNCFPMLDTPWYFWLWWHWYCDVTEWRKVSFHWVKYCNICNKYTSINFRVTCHFIRVLIGLKSSGYLYMYWICK
jgi:hypothetical protein